MKAGFTERIDHRSHEARGLRDLPTIKVGNGPSRKRRAAKNDEIRQLNGELRIARKERAKANVTELANRFIRKTDPPAQDDTMNERTAQAIRQKIDSLLAIPVPPLTLDKLLVELRPLGVTMLQDRHSDLFWKVDGQPVAEVELGHQYIRSALVSRGLVIEEISKKAPLGFLNQAQTEHAVIYEDDDLAKALYALLKMMGLLSSFVQNTLIRFLNLVLKLLGIDYQIELREAPGDNVQGAGPANHHRLTGTGRGDVTTKSEMARDVNELARKVAMVVKPASDQARLERARRERSEIFKEEKSARSAAILATIPKAKRELEQLQKTLARSREQFDVEIQELELQLLPTHEREALLVDHLAELERDFLEGEREVQRTPDRQIG